MVRRWRETRTHSRCPDAPAARVEVLASSSASAGCTAHWLSRSAGSGASPHSGWTCRRSRARSCRHGWSAAGSPSALSRRWTLRSAARKASPYSCASATLSSRTSSRRRRGGCQSRCVGSSFAVNTSRSAPETPVRARQAAPAPSAHPPVHAEELAVFIEERRHLLLRQQRQRCRGRSQTTCQMDADGIRGCRRSSSIAWRRPGTAASGCTSSLPRA